MKEHKNIIGVGGSIHDFSSCLIQDGNLKYYLEDERIVRKKHAYYPGMTELMYYNAADICLEDNELTFKDIDLVVGNDILSSFYCKRIKKSVTEFKSINHHLAHSSSAFYPSSFDEAAILTIDGGGNEFTHEDGENKIEVCSLGVGCGKEINLLKVQKGIRLKAKQFENKIDPVINSLGGFYGAATYASGFTFHEEGKTMGLAPYGTSRYLKELMEYITLENGGIFKFSLAGLNYLYQFRKIWEKEKDQEKQFSYRADIAYAAQFITEKALIHVAEYLRELTRSENICLAGGVILNSVANYKLYKAGLFKNYFIQPAAGDNGTSIGAAYYGWHVIMNQDRQIKGGS
ncbi:MAG: hypothetical protein FWC09_01305 [Lachnospiraceae bacterium]|nr:hypothetical protein [Lachnospiraceae bacterium]